MKKSIALLTIILLVSSCSSSNRVCGGKGGRRCVEVGTEVKIVKEYKLT